jgi:hypothetical protein
MTTEIRGEDVDVVQGMDYSYSAIAVGAMGRIIVVDDGTALGVVAGMADELLKQESEAYWHEQSMAALSEHLYGEKPEDLG